ncbi:MULTISPECIES: CBS domain-containing protein [Arcobacter]|jgi:CBS domain-containing protein|uniref:CBS domain-containing protein n=2 Tax=Arcobacter TaxID=28196 RepID=A0A347U9C2_9BACT|nr:MULTISPECIES: CBS domain-containing protein [Arcobacter]AXX95450.1 CBS domain-containing protein [Arcobacter ellisii]MDD3008815.1 CBS domain-containing protein [Arcobacter sp.]RXI29900.1 histidine kinase [Arcobacter ellisii]
MLVEQLMKKNVTTIKPYATLKEALQLMKEKNLKSLVVEKNSPSDAYGLITNTQILKAIVAEDGDIELLNVYDLYKKPAFSVSSKIDVKYAAKIMIEHNIKRVVVTDNNELLGVLSITDLTHYLMTWVE